LYSHYGTIKDTNTDKHSSMINAVTPFDVCVDGGTVQVAIGVNTGIRCTSIISKTTVIKSQYVYFDPNTHSHLLSSLPWLRFNLMGPRLPAQHVRNNVIFS
jgi:hypothetical protein